MYITVGDQMAINPLIENSNNNPHIHLLELDEENLSSTKSRYFNLIEYPKEVGGIKVPNPTQARDNIFLSSYPTQVNWRTIYISSYGIRNFFDVPIPYLLIAVVSTLFVVIGILYQVMIPLVAGLGLLATIYAALKDIYER